MDKEYNTFSDEIRREIVEAQNGYCCINGCLKKIHSLHHVIENTVPNNRLYPLLVQSPINCKGVCFAHHVNRREYEVLNMTDKTATAIENFLRGLTNG